MSHIRTVSHIQKKCNRSQAIAVYRLHFYFYKILSIFENKTDNKKDDAGKNYDRADGVKRQAEPRRQKRENGKTGNGAGNADNYGQ